MTFYYRNKLLALYPLSLVQHNILKNKGDYLDCIVMIYLYSIIKIINGECINSELQKYGSFWLGGGGESVFSHPRS